MRIRTKIKRAVVKFKRATNSIKKSVDTNVKLDEVQEISYQIVRKAMRNPESTLMYAPITRTYYIEYGHYCVKMIDNSISIINGKISYFVWLPESQVSELKRIFDKVSQQRSNRLDSQYNQSTLRNLRKVLTYVNSTNSNPSYN